MNPLVKQASHDVAFTPEQEQHIRTIVCKGASPDEVEVFMMLCKHTRLNPIMKQIYFISRWDGKLQKNVFTPQTSIDGLRLIADRTGKYCPGPRTQYDFDKDGKLISATAFVKKQTQDGTWHTVENTAFYSEYVQTFKDKQSGEMAPTKFWSTNPCLMLSKCAETGALKKAFPAEMANLYIEEEMPDAVVDVDGSDSGKMTQEQLNELYEISVQLPDLTEKIKEHYKIGSFMQLDPTKYQIVKDRLSNELAKKQKLAEAELKKAMDGE